MKYENPTFTLPVSNRPITQTDYEIAVGLRCPKCQALLGRAHKCKESK